MTTVVYVHNPSLRHGCLERWATLGDGTERSMRETESHRLEEKKKKTGPVREVKGKGSIFPSSLRAECESRKTIKNHRKETMQRLNRNSKL